MSTRAFAGAPASVDVQARAFDIVITTETPVREWVRNPEVADENARNAYIEADVVLLGSGLDLSRARGMPLMDTHDMWSGIRKVLGKIENLRLEDGKVVGRATLTRSNADLIEDIADGFYSQISAGFYLNALELEHRDGDVPLARATSWTLFEGSMVPVGADPNAYVRGMRAAPMPKVSVRNARETEKPKMELKDAIEAAEAALAVVDEAVKEAGDGADKELVERARKLREVAAPVDEDKDKDVAAAAEAARSEDAAATEDEKKEEAEVRSIRAAAANLGLGDQVDRMKALGMRSADIKAAVAKTLAARGLADAPAAAAKPAPVQTQRSAPVIDTTAIYARRNKR